MYWYTGLIFVKGLNVHKESAVGLGPEGGPCWQNMRRGLRKMTHTLIFFSTEQHILINNAGKQLWEASTVIYLTLALKKWTAFKFRLELWPSDVSK